METYGSHQDEAKHKEQTVVCRRKRHILEEIGSPMSKISKESEKLIKMKIHQDGVNWDLCDKLQTSEEINEKLKVNLLNTQTEFEKLSVSYEAALDNKAKIRHRTESAGKLLKFLTERVKLENETMNEMKKEKDKFGLELQRVTQEMGNIKSSISNTETKHAHQMALVQQKCEEKDRTIEYQKERISELNASILALQQINAKDQDESRSTVSTYNKQIAELQNSILQLQEENAKKIMTLQEENAKQIATSTLSFAEMEKKCSLNECEINHLLKEIATLKEEKDSTEKKLSEQEISFEKEIFISKSECIKLEESNKAKINLNQEYVQKIQMLESQVQAHKSYEEKMDEEKKKNEKELIAMCAQLEAEKQRFQTMEKENGTLLNDIEMLKMKYNTENKILNDLYLEKERTSKAKELEFANKIESLDNHLKVKAKELFEIEEQYKEACSQIKRLKDIEINYSSLIDRHEVTQREFRNMCMKEAKANTIASPLVGSSSADTVQKTSSVLVWKVPVPPVPKEQEILSDSDESDCYKFDARVMQKRFESFTKAEQNGKNSKLKKPTHPRDK